MEKTPKRLLSDYILLELEKMSPEKLANIDISKGDLNKIKNLDNYLIEWILTERYIDVTPIIVQAGDWNEEGTNYTEIYKVNNKFIKYTWDGNISRNGTFKFEP
jgi:hypothetical protein